MAEILISLTIIGVVAAITLPALQANINEKTWATQRKALYSRMSQAIGMMPSLNGYGVVFENGSINETETANKAAQAFITDGLSKVLKISNICDNANLKKCGLPDNITTLDNTRMNFPVKLSELNSGILGTMGILNINAVGMETANGESIGVFYNPRCMSKDIMPETTNDAGDIGYFVKQHVCVNFLYDLNGRKGPNKIGKDIGYITVFYPTDSEVTMVLPAKYVGSAVVFKDTVKKCKSINKDYRVPNREEAVSIYYNNLLNGTGYRFWTSTSVDETYGWYIGYYNGSIYPYEKTSGHPYLCVKR